MMFSKFAQGLARWMGSPNIFLLAVVLVCVWAATGPWFHYNEAWQLVINTSTTIITFLMVFLIQNTQNRDTDVMHLKVDELLRATKDAQNALLSLDSLDEEELHQLRKKYKALGTDEVSDPVAPPRDEPDIPL
jgi:low affinity Fe/Cu permease